MCSQCVEKNEDTAGEIIGCLEMGNLPFVSIIIPCRNEGSFIGKCLDSIVEQVYPKELTEIIVVDGMSDDNTRRIIANTMLNHSFIKLLDNPLRIVPTALNIGIKAASGIIIVRMDAHNRYETDYISKCVKYLLEHDADNVGGVWVTLPAQDTLLAHSIAFALAHPFGVGNAHYRIGAKEPIYVDTVPFGCYNREVFDKIGLFDEDLVRNQDDEFNLRLIKNGGKILLVPDIVSYYYARDTLSKVARMFYQYGYFKPLVVRKVGGVLTWRQMIPALFVACLIVTGVFSIFLKPFLWLFLLIASLYLAANLGASLHVAVRKGLKFLPVLPAVFATLHFSYGIGYLKGIWDFLLLKKHKKKKIHDVPLTR